MLAVSVVSGLLTRRRDFDTIPAGWRNDAVTVVPGNEAAKEARMSWEAPSFVEVRMDAEINSYQDDFDRDSDDSI
jgi:coenzyme PQQ precursor peptide PqqA